jgi:aromatic-L-amino-acid decarboxylase
VQLAKEFAGWVAADGRFALAAPVRLSLVCFRLRADDAANQRLLDLVNASGRMYLSHTRLADGLVLRMAIGGTLTERRHVEAAWALLRTTADALL